MGKSIKIISMTLLFVMSIMLPYKIYADNVKKERDTTIISRRIDVSEDFRPFPDLAAYWNTSLQKVSAPILGKIGEESFGKAKIIRCWLNLDEMWDYRTREFDFNFRIGVDKYKDIKEKHRETWNSELESSVHYCDYIKAFSTHSEEIMLTIRRYERDILDSSLPVSKDDWKMIFKKGLLHYKKLFPNIRYVEVCNEYALKSFMASTDEEYYLFYKLGYEAVNEVNEELQLNVANRILVGGPVVTGPVIKQLDAFFGLFSKDESKNKTLDFVSWHDYHTDIAQTSYREKEIKSLLLKYGLSENLPLYVTEHDPYHFSEDKLEYHFLNAACLPKSLYFYSLYSPNVKIFPWVLYHNAKIQTKFMWFDGPNETDTKASEIKMLPLGASMRALSLHKGREIPVENDIKNNDLVLVSASKNKIVVQAINLGSQKKIRLSLTSINKRFSQIRNGKLKVEKYLIDSKHSNCLTNSMFAGGLEKVEESLLKVNKGNVTLEESELEKNGIVLWEISLQNK